MLVGYTVVKPPFSFPDSEGSVLPASTMTWRKRQKCRAQVRSNTMIKVILPVIFPAIMSIIIRNFNRVLIGLRSFGIPVPSAVPTSRHRCEGRFGWVSIH